MAAVTVLVPTHDHGVLLRYAVSSALRQTVREIEVLIVGDGADEATAREAAALAERDPRVRFLPYPKGPRHGEVHRTQALREARGAIVAYLADDDLWLPSHLESLTGALKDADFAHGRSLIVFPDQSLGISPGDFAVPGVRERLFEHWNFLSLSCGGHTRALYDRLDGGWETTPPDVWTDLHMWRRLLCVPGCRAVSASRPTVLHFPSPYRRDWPLARREDELRQWSARLERPGFESELTLRALEMAIRSMTGFDLALEAKRRENSRLASEGESARREAEIARAQVRAAHEDAAVAERQRKEIEHRLAIETKGRQDAEAEAVVFRATAQAMSATVTWRVRSRLAALPGVSSAWRRLAGWRSRR